MPSGQSNVGKRALFLIVIAMASAIAGYWVTQSRISETNIQAPGPASDFSTRPDSSGSDTDNRFVEEGSSPQAGVISPDKLANEINTGLDDNSFGQPRANAGLGQDITLTAPVWELRVQEASEWLWQAASNTPVPSSVCPPPKITGLSCSKQEVNVWNDVMALNRPVLLEIVTKDKFAAAALVLAFGEATALMWTRQGVLEVPLGELADSWTGGVRYLWQAPQGWTGSVGLGDTSPVVNVIAQMFATLDGMAVPTVTSFGPALEARVRLFQVSEGIAADGVVGEQTILRLNDRLGIGLTSQRALERSSMWVTQTPAADSYQRDQR